jgi:membrane protease YdiL (CAAX protease family)
MALSWGTILGSVFLEEALGHSLVLRPPEVWGEVARVESFDGLDPDAAGPAVPDPEARTEVVADYRATLRSSWSANVLLAWLLGCGASGYALLGWLQRRDFLRRHPEHLPPGAQEAQATGDAGRSPGLSTVQSVTTGLLLGAGIGVLSMGLASAFEGLAPPPVSLGPGLFNLLATTPVGFCLALLVGVLAFPLAEELFFRGWAYPYLEHNAGRIAAYLGSVGLWVWSTTSDLSAGPLLQALVIGLSFTWAYDRWRSLLVPGIAHATMSGIVLVLSKVQAPLF